VEKYVKEEFLRGKIYGCKIVLTNITSATKRLSLLQQIPVGAIPVGGGFYTDSAHVELRPFSTTNPPLEFLFYFPQIGNFDHFPVHVSCDEKGKRALLKVQKKGFTHVGV
jgi:hypothetical protein